MRKALRSVCRPSIDFATRRPFVVSSMVEYGSWVTRPRPFSSRIAFTTLGILTSSIRATSRTVAAPLPVTRTYTVSM